MNDRVKALDTARIRQDFECLVPQGKQAAPIYLDNACMTLKPKQVLDAMMSYYLEHPSCHNRAVHAFGQLTTEKFESAREIVAKHLHASPEHEVVFTRNTTEAINLVANGFRFRGSLLLSVPALTWNPTHSPSGEKNGLRARSLPRRGLATS